MKLMPARRWSAIILSIILVFEAISSQHMVAYADEDNGRHKMTISIELNSGGWLAQYAVDVFVGSEKICTLKCGQTYSDYVELKDGLYRIWFFRSDKNSIWASEPFTIKEECNLSINLTDQSDSIVINDFSQTHGINKTVSIKKKLHFLDSYSLLFSYTESNTSTLRGRWGTYYYIDLVNNILITVNWHEGRGKKSEHYYAYKVSISEDFKIKEIKEDGTLSATYKALNYGKDGRLACIYYNEKGEKTEEHTLNTVSQPIPDNLQKLGFFDEYPTPSSLDK